VKFPEKGLSTMAAIWPSTERVKKMPKPIDMTIQWKDLEEHFLMV
jgi:hypothetical protein